jgi:hypothetical protein
MEIHIITAFAISQNRVVLLGSFEDRCDAVAAFDDFIKRESPKTEWFYDWACHKIGDQIISEILLVNIEQQEKEGEE